MTNQWSDTISLCSWKPGCQVALGECLMWQIFLMMVSNISLPICIANNASEFEVYDIALMKSVIILLILPILIT